jgi:hypothetical protein
MENILILLRHVDEKLDRISPNNNNNNNRSSTSTMPKTNVKFSSIQEMS